MDNKDMDLWIRNRGSFVVIDYKLEGNEFIIHAQGKLDDISENGDVLIKHLKHQDRIWKFNLFKIEIINYSFDKLRINNET